MIASSKGVESVKQLIKDTVLGRKSLNDDELMIEIETIVDEHIPKQIGLHTQKG